MSKKFSHFYDYMDVVSGWVSKTSKKKIKWRRRGSSWTARIDGLSCQCSDLRVIVTDKETRMNNLTKGLRYKEETDPVITSELIQAIVLGLNFKQ